MKTRLCGRQMYEAAGLKTKDQYTCQDIARGLFRASIISTVHVPIILSSMELILSNKGFTTTLYEQVLSLCTKPAGFIVPNEDFTERLSSHGHTIETELCGRQ